MVVTRGKNHTKEEESGHDESTMFMLIKLQRELEMLKKRNVDEV